MTQLTIYHDPSTLSLNQRLHWRERASRNQAAKEAARLGWLLAGRPRFDAPVRVSALVRRGRVMDSDNAIAGMKPLWDGLVACGMFPDDSAKWIMLVGVTFDTGKQWEGRPEVVLTVEEVTQDVAAARRTGGRGERSENNA